MKVLFLSVEHDVGRSASAYAHRLAHLRGALDAQGVETDFVSLRDQRVSRPILAHALTVPALRNRIADCDFIHAGGDAAYAAAWLKPFTRAHIVHDVHGDAVSEAELAWRSERNLRNAYLLFQAFVLTTIAYRRSDYFLVVARPQARRLVVEQHISAERIAMVRNGADLELFSQSGRPSTKGFLVAYAGGFQHWQGMPNLVEAFERIQDPGIRLKIVGFAEEDADLKRDLAVRLGSRVDLVDRVSRDRLISELAPADVLIIPRPAHRAVEVALPTKFGEYLALGKPVIVTDVDETADLVRQHRCGLVSEPEPSALTDAVLHASRLSPRALDEMGNNARQLAEAEFSWSRIGTGYGESLATWHRGRLDWPMPDRTVHRIGPKQGARPQL